MTEKLVVSEAVETAFRDAWEDGTAWDATLAAIAQDRLERPFREEEPAQEVPCANSFYVLDEVHQVLRDRAYVAIEVMKAENYTPQTAALREAASKCLLEFLGCKVEKVEEAAPKPPSTPYPWPEAAPAADRDDMNMGLPLTPGAGPKPPAAGWPTPPSAGEPVGIGATDAPEKAQPAARPGRFAPYPDDQGY